MRSEGADACRHFLQGLDAQNSRRKPPKDTTERLTGRECPIGTGVGWTDCTSVLRRIILEASSEARIPVRREGH